MFMPFHALGVADAILFCHIAAHQRCLLRYGCVHLTQQQQFPPAQLCFMVLLTKILPELLW